MYLREKYIFDVLSFMLFSCNASVTLFYISSYVLHVMLYILSERFCEVIRFRLRQDLEYLFAFCNQLQLTNPFTFVPTAQEPSCVQNAQKPSSTPRSCRPKRLKREIRKLLNMIAIYTASLFLECFDRDASSFFAMS